MFYLYLPYIKKMFGIGKKIILVVLVYFTIIALFSHFINKDKSKLTADPIQKNRQEIYKMLNDPELNKTQQGKITIAIYRMWTCSMVGEACTNNPADGNKNFKNSLFGFMSNLIVMPYANPPASGLYWASTGLQNAGFVPKTYAAEGIGFASLRPFMNLWKVFRNLAYMLLVLVLITIGFMIMFRMKLNPQTVISVENALPKIVISLLLITFSFAIAGFLIDLMYVIIATSVALLSDNGTLYNIGEFQNKYLSSNIFTIWDSMFAIKPSVPKVNPFGIDLFGVNSTLFTIGDALMGIFPRVVNDFVRIIVLFFAVYGVTFPILSHITQLGAGSILENINIIGTGIGKLPTPILQGIIYVLVYLLVLPPFLIHGGGFIISIILLLTMLLLFLRIAFLLFKAYIQILLMVIFSPLFLLFEAIPGRSAFSFWFKNLVAEVLTFPVVVVLFVIGYIIVNTAPTPGIITPPMLGIDPNIFTILLGMGIIFMIPNFVKMVKGALGIKEGVIPGFDLGVFFGGAATGVGGATGLLGQFSSVGLGISALRNKLYLFGGEAPETKKNLQRFVKQPKGSIPAEETGEGNPS